MMIEREYLIKRWKEVVGKNVLVKAPLRPIFEAEVLQVTPGGRVKLQSESHDPYHRWYEMDSIRLVEVLPGEKL